MNVAAQKMLVLGLIGCVVIGFSVFQQKNGHDGSGWGLVGFLFLLSSCSQ